MTKIIQITDTHIVGRGELAYGRVDTAAALSETVDTINRMLPQLGDVGMVMVTGDLTEHGNAQEYDYFRTLMAPLALPYCVVPGNHDKRDPMRAAFITADGQPGWMPDAGPINWSIDLGDIAVIGLDTLVEGSPHGLLTDESLAYLTKELARFGDKPVLAGMHHPPFETGIYPMDMQNLKNADALLVAIANHPGELRLTCGHVHRSVATVFGGRLCQIAPGTSHAVTLEQRRGAGNSLTVEPGGMLLHELRDGALVSHLIPVGSFAGPYPFVGV